MSESDSDWDLWPSPPNTWCVSQARCRACQFGLANGELICFSEKMNPPPIVANKVSCAFKYRESAHEERYIDSKRDLEVHVHARRFEKTALCSVQPSFCLHSHCRPLLLFSLTPSFLATTNHVYTPSSDDERRRRQRLQVAQATTLCESSLGPALPAELWHMVAAHMTQEYAVIAAQDGVRGFPKMRIHDLDLRRPVYASYVKFEGNIYLRDLHNDALDTEAGTWTVRLLPGALGSTEMDLYIAQDYLGIRQAVFIPPEKREAWCRDQALDPEVWWRRVSLGGTCGNVQVHIKSDGLKIRDFQDDSQHTRGDYLSNLLWRAPLPSPPHLLYLVTLAAPVTYLFRRRMTFFECNHPDAVGYLIACTGGGVYDIAADRRGDKTVPTLLEGTHLYQWPSWMYMPLDEGEYITHISRQTIPPTSFRDARMNLMFTTNKGRNTVFGGHYTTVSEQVFALPHSESRVYFNCWNNPDSIMPIKYMALESRPQPDPSPPLEAPKLPTPLGTPSLSRLQQDWAHTACSLNGVSEILPCTKRTNFQTHAPVIGMLVSYTNGHRECIGQFRPDWAVEPISLLGEETLFLQQIQKAPGLPSIIGVRARAPCADDGVGWTAVPIAGVLEWWFALRYSILFLDGRRIEVPEDAAESEFMSGSP